MDLTLHWHSIGRFKNLTDESMPYKKQLGHHSSSLDSKIEIAGLGKKINLKWKINLTNKLSGTRFKADTPCTVYYGSYKFEINGRKTPKEFVNRIANLILRSRHEFEYKIGVMNTEKLKKAVKL